MVALGTKLSVSWGSRWYEATIVYFDKETKICDILYAKGDFEQSRLEDITYRVIPEEEEDTMAVFAAKSPATKSPSSAFHCHKTRDLLLDFEDLLPMWAVSEKEQWWDGWRKRVGKAVRNLPSMKEAALDFAAKLNSYVVSDWWIENELSWKDRVDAADNACQLHKLVVEMRALAIKWALIIADQAPKDGGSEPESFAKNIKCAMCHEGGDIDRLGRFIDSGMKTKGRRVVVHEYCALWAPEVHEDGEGHFCDLPKAIRRGQKLTCRAKDCKKNGATLGCKNETCRRTYHYGCAARAGSGCTLNKDTFVLFCEEHAHMDDEPFNNADASNTNLSHSGRKRRTVQQRSTSAQKGSRTARRGRRGQRENSNSPPEEAKKAASHCGVVGATRVQTVNHRSLERDSSPRAEEEDLSEDNVWVDACVVQESPAILGKRQWGNKEAISVTPSAPSRGDEKLPGAKKPHFASHPVQVGVQYGPSRGRLGVMTAEKNRKAHGMPLEVRQSPLEVCETPSEVCEAQMRTPLNAPSSGSEPERPKFMGTDTDLWTRIREMTAGFRKEEAAEKGPKPPAAKPVPDSLSALLKTNFVSEYKTWFNNRSKGKMTSATPPDQTGGKSTTIDSNPGIRSGNEGSTSKGKEVSEEETPDSEVGSMDSEDDEDLLSMPFQIGSIYSCH